MAQTSPNVFAAVIKPRADGTAGTISMRTYNKMFNRDETNING